MRTIMTLAVLIAFTGCAALDRPVASEFEPAGDGFKFKAKPALIGYPEDTAAGERVRMQWLDQYLADNKMCAKGYRITERNVVRGSSAPMMIYYSGVCVP